MSHTGNDVDLDQIRACRIAPDTLRMPAHLAHEIGFGGQAVDIGPLLDDVLRILWIDDAVGAALPNGELWPRSVVRRGGADEIAPLLGRALGPMCHRLEGGLNRR